MKTNTQMIIDSFNRRIITDKDLKMKMLYKVFQSGNLQQHYLLLKRLNSCNFIIRSDNSLDVIARK